MKKLFKKLSVSFLVGLFLLQIIPNEIAADKLNGDTEPKTEIKETPQQAELINANNELYLYIEKLAKCESNNNPKAINWEDHGSPSYGYLQWKHDSFYRYNQIHKVLPDIAYNEVANVIMDKDIQIELTYRVLKAGGWRNWYNCGKSLNFDKVKSWN